MNQENIKFFHPKAVDRNRIRGTGHTSHAAYQLVWSLKTFWYNGTKGMGRESASFSKVSLSLGKGAR